MTPGQKTRDDEETACDCRHPECTACYPRQRYTSPEEIERLRDVEEAAHGLADQVMAFDERVKEQDAVIKGLLSRVDGLVQQVVQLRRWERAVQNAYAVERRSADICTERGEHVYADRHLRGIELLKSIFKEVSDA